MNPIRTRYALHFFARKNRRKVQDRRGALLCICLWVAVYLAFSKWMGWV